MLTEIKLRFLFFKGWKVSQYNIEQLNASLNEIKFKIKYNF